MKFGIDRLLGDAALLGDESASLDLLELEPVAGADVGFHWVSLMGRKSCLQTRHLSQGHRRLVQWDC